MQIQIHLSCRRHDNFKLRGGLTKPTVSILSSRKANYRHCFSLTQTRER